MAHGRKTGGRMVGTPNKNTAERVEAIESCFAGIGGIDALMRWAKRNPGQFYTKVWARLLPREMSMEVKTDLDFAAMLGARLKRARERTAEFEREKGDSNVS